MRLRTLCVALGLVVAGCASSGGDQSSSTTLAAVEPVPGGTYGGPIEAQPNLTGWVTIEISATGSEIVGLVLGYEMTDYSCGGNIVINGPGAAAPMGIAVPIVDGAFDYPSSMGIAWRGTFSSENQVTGTLEGDLVSPPCPIGPLSWTADLREVGQPDGDSTSTSRATSTTAEVWVMPPEYIELCAISQRILDRVTTAPPSSENAADFWIAQRDDWVAMVDLVPQDLRADMEVRAEAWRQVVDLLEQYDFVFDAMLADVGVEAFNQIFLAAEVVDAGTRIDEFLSGVCFGE